MNNELGPCPFCGGDMVKRTRGLYGLNFFKCYECGAVVSFDNDYYNHRTDEAVNAYNRRAEPEIIHCRDCKFNDTGTCRWYYGVGLFIVPDDGFCHHARRRLPDA